MDFRGAAYGTGSAFVESPVAAEMAIQLGLKPLPIDNWDGSLIRENMCLTPGAMASTCFLTLRGCEKTSKNFARRCSLSM
jgi:hypothetical protein